MLLAKKEISCNGILIHHRNNQHNITLTDGRDYGNPYRYSLYYGRLNGEGDLALVVVQTSRQSSKGFEVVRGHCEANRSVHYQYCAVSRTGAEFKLLFFKVFVVKNQINPKQLSEPHFHLTKSIFIAKLN